MKCELQDDPNLLCSGPVSLRGARTQYHFEGVIDSPEDPNRHFAACEEHSAAYDEYWDEMWADYYGIVKEGLQGGLIARERCSIQDDDSSLQDIFDNFRRIFR